MRRHSMISAGGFTYIGVLFAVVLAGVALTLTAEVWRTANQRAREAELIFVGSQFAQAIRRYYEQGEGAARAYPKSIETLLLDPRFPDKRRYLRRLYADPMTGKTEWGLVRDGSGGISGVYSTSDDQVVRIVPIYVNGISVGGPKYSDWKFVYDPGQSPSPAGPAIPTTAANAANTANVEGAATADATAGNSTQPPVPIEIILNRGGRR